MADSDTSLLLRIKGDSTGGKAAIAETRAAIASLRTSSGTHFNEMQNVATSALGKVTQSLTGLAGQVPIVGGAVNSLSTGLASMATQGNVAAGSLAAIAGPIGIAVAAIGALAAGSVFLGKALFDLAEKAADFRGKMFDLSQQTGVAVETLSALEIVAKTTGGNIDSIAQSLVIFQGKLDEAQDTGSKAGKMFAELGISTHNTEDAFKSALTQIAKMPEGFHQTNTAAEFFGRRGGKQVLAMIKEMNGDLPGTIAKLRELGLVISKEDAEAADKFNDQLAILQFQIRGLLGKEVIPAALKALQDLSKFIKDNKAAIDTLGNAIGSFSSIIGSGLKTKLVELQGQLALINGVLDIQARFFDRIARTMGLIAATNFGAATAGVGGISPPEVGGSGTVSLPGKKGASVSGADPAAAAVRMEALRLQATLERLSEEDRATKRSLDQRKFDFERYAAEIKFTEDTRHFLVMAGLVAEGEAAEGLRSGLQREIALKEIENKKLEENNRHKQAAEELDDRRAEIEKEITDTVEKLNKATAEYVITVDAYQQAVDDLVESLGKQGVTLDPLIEQTLRFDAAMAGARDRVREALKALEDLSNAPAPPSVEGISEEEIGRRAGDAANAVSGAAPILQGTASAIDQLFGAINTNLTGDTHTAALAGLQTMVDVFGDLGQAVGQAVRAFVLYGSAGTSVRKVTAEILASVAQMAAVKAIFELAEGFAALALAFFGIPNAGPSAQAHFIAAATYGAIAGVAAVAGRAVAGDSFTKQAGAGGSTGGGGGTRSSGPPTTREFDRTGGSSQSPIIVNVTVVGQATEGFKYMVEKAVSDSVRDNGVMRRIQNGEFV